MNPTPCPPVSLATQFRKNYFVLSTLPLLLLLIITVLGATITRTHLTHLISKSTYDLNLDAELHLQKLGEQIIQDKARDVASQLEIYFRMHPDLDITQMRKDPFFMKIAIQKVGETGYTAVTEARTYLFRVHPNERLNDRNMHFLAEKMPSWWKIVQEAIDGDEALGYYDWIEPDGSVRQKFLVTTPVKFPLNGVTFMVSATTYIDEFSKPIVYIQEKADTIIEQYQNYLARQWLIFSAVAAVIILLTFIGTYFLGSRAALRYIHPIVRLSEEIREFGEGKWTLGDEEEIIQRKDEIGSLAQTFKRMATQLADLFNRLELRLSQLNEAQAALKESEKHYKTLYEESKRAREVYQSLINSSADAIVIYDLNGRATYVSPMFTEIFGWSSEELIDKQIPYLPESERQSTLAKFREVIDKGKSFHGFETKRFTKDKQLIDISLSVSRYDDHLGKPAGMLVILRDISEKKRIEAHFQSVERMEAIGTLAGGIAHDFNNLLMVIQGSIAILKKGMHPSHSDYRFLLNMEKQIQRGSRLTSQLLGYARKGRYEVKAVNLNEIVMESSETFQRTRKDIIVKYHLEDNLLPVEADIDQIEQVLMNLYINAADAMPDGGELIIETQNVSPDKTAYDTWSPESKELVMLKITDTGIGMSPKVMERIFDPFFTTKEMGRGTGLGLASVYGIIDGHCGHIDVVSTEGQGTSFVIYFQASEKSITVQLVESYKVSQGKGTILLIDDEQLVLDVTSEMVGNLGYTVLIADSGPKAIEIFKTHFDTIDLVILDMIMPDMSGSTLFDHLMEINPDARILLCSGYSIDGKAEEIINRGCKGFIQKPYTVEQLAQKINEALK